MIMKAIHRIYMLFFLALLSSPVFAQGLLNNNTTRGAGMLSGSLPENARFSLELGTGFTSFSSGSMLGSYISPTLEFDVNPSLTIIAGGSFSFNQYNNLQQRSVVNTNRMDINAPMQQGMTDYSMFVSGRYALSENLTMTGTVYREEGQLPLFMSNPGLMGLRSNQGLMDYQNHGMSMGLQYRISDNLHFGAEVGVNRTNNPYQLYSPFSDPFRHNRRHRAFPY